MATKLSDIQNPRLREVDLRDDRTLVLDFKSGDEEAFSDIYLRYRPLVAKICHRVLQDHRDAEEAAQETMLRVLRGLPRFNGRYQLQAWVARIATNVSLDMLRVRSRRPLEGAPLHEVAEQLGTPDEGLIEEVERMLEAEQVKAVLETLPDHHREALMLREFEGRSHQEIGTALGLSPAQAKALIHRAKKNFRRAWDEGSERRRGIAALAPILLAPFRWVPALLKRAAQPAHDAISNASATAQQAAANVSSAPVVAQTAVSAADKVTAAALTVIVAGTVGVGAVAIRHHTAPPAKSAPTSASPAPLPTSSPPPVGVVAPPVKSKPAPKPHKSHHHAVRPAHDGQASPSSNPTSSPSPTDPGSSPSPGGVVTPPPPPPAPAWSGSFDTSGGITGAHLALISSPHVFGQGSQQTLFSETLEGPVVGPKGKQLGSVYVDLGGSVADTHGSLSSLWLWVDAPDGRYGYTASGVLTAVTKAADGSTTYVFTGEYHLSATPTTIHTEVPHDGTISISVGFWADGSLYATMVSMTEA